MPNCAYCLCNRRVKSRIEEDRPKSFLIERRASRVAPDRVFTLLEVMISLAIVGGLLVTLLYTLNYHLGIADRHLIVTVSTDLAKEKMYAMEKTPVTQKGAFPEPYSNYSYETSIRDSLMPGMSEIWVVVSNGKEKVMLSELIRKAK